MNEGTTDWVDMEPNRFGWRRWYLHDEGTRLFSPLHGGPARFGRLFAEQSICTHKPPDVDHFALYENCYCGIYYVPGHRRESLANILRMDWEAGLRRQPELTVLTYGVAVGGFGTDPAASHLMRTTRFRFLEMVVPGGRANEFRAQYPRSESFGGVWTAADLRRITHDDLDAIEGSARRRLRGVDSTGFLEDARREPALPASEHVCDVHPDHFGWQLWLIDDENENSAPRLIGNPTTGWNVALETSPDGPYIERAEGVSYFRSLSLAVMGLRMAIERSDVYGDGSMKNCAFAFTFGYAPGHVDAPINDLVSQRYNVLRLCIPETHAYVAESLRKRYGIEVAISTDTRALQAAEQSAWRELAGVSAATLFPEGASVTHHQPAAASLGGYWDGTAGHPRGDSDEARLAAAYKLAAAQDAAGQTSESAARAFAAMAGGRIETTIGGRPLSPLEFAATRFRPR
ncbi:hypothetical protein [Mycobacterium sp. URHD0025]|uniref:hypothetical protein n=1 Tax=Mycobacterium sp. URHD0025 TaxID=1298864 RepID=UPI00048C70FD|nr:hypothetical protein [Mycobacterium sp. URHD0025]